MFSPCHPVEKDETNDNKMETYLHYVIHTSNPLGKQKSLSVHEIQATDRSKYCYLLTGDTYTGDVTSPQTYASTECRTQVLSLVTSTTALQSAFHIYLNPKITSRYCVENLTTSRNSLK